MSIAVANDSQNKFSKSLTQGWVQSLAWDSIWMFSSIWLTIIVLFAGLTFKKAAAVIAFLALLQHFVALTHAWSTSYLVVFSNLFRDERRANRFAYVVMPIAVVALSLALGFLVAYMPEVSIANSIWAQWPIALYVFPYLAGHFWHFGRQDFGVLSLYRQRAGQATPIDRNFDEKFSILMMYILQPLIFLKWGLKTIFGETLNTVTFGALQYISEISLGALVIAVVASLYMIYREFQKSNSSIQKMLYYFVMLSHPIVLYKALIFYPLVYLWSHWLISIGLSGRVNVNFLEKNQGQSPRKALLKHILVLAAIALGFATLTYSYHDYNLFGASLSDAAKIFSNLITQNRFLAGVLLGYFLGEQLLHYYCDRCLFKFSNPNIRKLVGPLL